MAVYMDYLNLEKYFDSITRNKIIVNDIPITELDSIKDKMNTIYNNTTIDTTPMCDCGALKGRFREGKLCTKCNSTVRDMFGNNDPIIWLRRLEGTEKFINPILYNKISKVIDSNFDLLRWIGDITYNPMVNRNSVKITAIKHAVESINGFSRSYNWIVKNLSLILTSIKNLSMFKKNIDKINDIIDVIENRPEEAFSEVLPVINKSMLVVESNSKGKFTNVGVNDIIFDIVLAFLYRSKTVSQHMRERLMIKTCATSSEAYDKFVDAYLSGKHMLIRKNIYGTRSHFTARGVIKPIIGPHKYDELHMPWGMSLVLFRLHILNKLVNKYNYRYKEANNLIYASIHNYNDLIYNILQELLMESGNGIPVGFQRNPSLHQGSWQSLRITKFKKDPLDNSIGLSILVVKAPNADFDGDEMNLTLYLDKHMAMLMDNMAPYYSTLITDKIGEVSGYVNLSGPMTSTISNHIYNEKMRLLKKEGLI